MDVQIRQATRDDAPVVAGMLHEAAAWVDALGVVMWEEGELEEARIAAEVASGQFHLAECAGEPAGAVRFQLEDRLFWDDLPQGDACYVHRLVVRRAFAGRGVSTALLHWAVARTRQHVRPYLRLDCDASRERLRAMYERFGFTLHSFRQVGAYFVARYEYSVRP